MIDKTVAKKLSDDYKEYSPDVVSMDKNDVYEGKGFINKSKNASKAKTTVLGWDESLVAQSECQYIEKMVELCRKICTGGFLYQKPCTEIKCGVL